MNDTLRAALTSDEINFCVQLLDDENPDLDWATREIFSELSDPLLAADDIATLLNAPTRGEEIRECLTRLTEEQYLEYSDSTQRPFDPAGTRLYRKRLDYTSTLKIVALESSGGEGRQRYQFSINGRYIRSLARIDRLDSLHGTGNQRDEIRKHVDKIAQGIRSGTNVPSSILLVMMQEATDVGTQEDTSGAPASFIKIRPFADEGDAIEVMHNDEQVQNLRLVEIELPYRRAAFDEEKAILLVDGQQRTAAIAQVPIDELPVIDLGVTAVISNAEDAKRVFQVANDTVKITADFSRALLASMSEPPGYLRNEKLRADVTRMLAIELEDSPFKDLVKHPGIRANRPVAYNSLFSIVAQFAERMPEEAVATADDLAGIISNSYRSVQRTWPDSWGTKPGDSRLMHGVGLRAMAGLIIDKLFSYLERGTSIDSDEIWELLDQSLERLSARVVWTNKASQEGSKQAQEYYRDEISRRQNTSQDIRALTEFLRKESLALDTRNIRARTRAAR